MHVKTTRRIAFDACSIALFASLALGGGMAAAQFTVGPGPAPAKPATATPVTATSTAPAADAFRQVDTDGNGAISRAEALRAGSLARSFDKLDTNTDGALSRAEFEAAPRPPAR